MNNSTYKGHRLRAKNKFLKTKPGVLQDYEVLELLLFYSIPRKDVKALAKSLLKQFGNLGNLINCPTSKLTKMPGIGQTTITLIKLIKEILFITNKEQIIKKPILSSWEKLILYLRTNIGYSPTENMKVLYLNAKNILLGEELYDLGTVNRICIYPREILKAALYFEATGIILVHNHPSGITRPSKQDIDFTINIKDTLRVLDITLIDHVIISANSEFSFKSNSLF
ncbi:MAG: DNA repair protein RadC [Rickettsiales bacterium]|nr:DNA repair protein RadC [Rickettsiales bacterium]